MDDHTTKPVTLDALVAVLDRYGRVGDPTRTPPELPPEEARPHRRPELPLTAGPGT
jgi:hypothetical protein